MKLLRCYIENFGGLHQYVLEFQPGMTVIREPNGFGKTTLAAFLRCMFYGLPRGNKNTLEKDLRRKYTPWQRGKFGGSVEFEAEGQVYRVERTFGDRPSQDTFTLYEQPGLRRSRRFSRDLGVELFGLDGDSFERSTYLPQQRDTGPLSTANIQARLGNLVEDADDLQRYEKAVDSLRKARSSYIPYRGGGGKVEEAGRKVTLLQQELDRCRQVKEQLPEELHQLAALEEQIKAKNRLIAHTQQEIVQASSAEARRALGREYQGLLSRKAEIEEEARKISGRYPKGLPREEELTPVADALNRLAALSGDEESVWADILARFPEGVPTEEELNACQAAWEEYIALNAQLKAGRPSPEVAPAPRQGKGIGFLLLLMGGILAGLAGIVLLFLGRYPLGGGLLGAGVLCLTGAGYLNLRRMIGDAGSRPAGENPENRRQTEALLRRQTALEEQIGGFLGRYYPQVSPAEYGEKLAALRGDRAACLQAEQAQARQSRRERQSAQAEETVEDFFHRYQLTGLPRSREGLEAIREDLLRARRLKADYRQVKERLAAFTREHGTEFGPEPTGEPASIGGLKLAVEELSREVETLNQSLAEQRQRVARLRQEADRIPELTDQLDSWWAQREAGRKKAETLDKTISYLEKARQSLAETYLDRIQGGFVRYMNQMLPEEDSGAVFVSPELEVSLQRGGQARELGYFSAGYADLVRICMRLALIDALFQGEKPFLILDDPFVNLDDENLARALELLRRLSREEQVVYLVCSKSRC